MAKQVSDGMTLAANRNKFSASAKTGITMHKSFHTVVMTLALLAGCGGGGASSQSATAPADDITSSQPSLLADCGGSSASSQSASASSQSTAVASTFGLSADSNFFTIDTGAGLVFKVRRSNPNNDTSTTSPGDIASMVYNGVQYQDASRGSQVNSGFDNLYKGVTDVVVDAGFVDTFRISHTGNGFYTWWSHFANARARNVGWRIDYVLTSKSLEKKITKADILPEVMGSDHCPVLLDIAL